MAPSVKGRKPGQTIPRKKPDESSSSNSPIKARKKANNLTEADKKIEAAKKADSSAVSKRLQQVRNTAEFKEASPEQRDALLSSARQEEMAKRRLKGRSADAVRELLEAIASEEQTRNDSIIPTAQDEVECSPESTSIPKEKDPDKDKSTEGGKENRGNQVTDSNGLEPLAASSSLEKASASPILASLPSEMLEYSDGCQPSTTALLRKFGVYGEEDTRDGRLLSPEIASEVQKCLDNMPNRQILDFLVRHFVAEVNWMDQIIYTPWLLDQYLSWWSSTKACSLKKIEFAVLFLRICSFASLSLPSATHTAETIHDMSLGDIRQACDDIADRLVEISSRLDSKGSLLRVQHLALVGLKAQHEGRINFFWHTIRHAMQVVQIIGLDQETTEPASGVAKEIRRRVLCNLYIWDRLLSRQLGAVTVLSIEQMPQLSPDLAIDDMKAPDEFAERVLQARLADFWKQHGPIKFTTYDAILAQTRFEALCSEFLAALPPAFALQPIKKWDEQLPKLPLQRELLHISIFDSLCSNFRPLLLQDSAQAEQVPRYLQVLQSSQRQVLAFAALNVLSRASALATMSKSTRMGLPAIIVPTFEAAVTLMSLLTDPVFLEEPEKGHFNVAQAGLPGIDMTTLNRQACKQAVHDAINILQTHAKASSLAELEAQALSKLVGKVFGPAENS